MSETNFDYFNKISLYVLVKLFDEFPKPINIDSSWVAAHVLYEDSESQDTAFNKFEFCAQSISWLEEEGFISIKNNEYIERPIGVRLTLKGLTLLGYSMPNKDGETFIKQAKDVLDGSIKQTATDLLAGFFSSAINIGIKTIVSS